MLYLWCQECDTEIEHSASKVHSHLAVANSIARLTNAMKKHQADYHEDKDVIFEMKIGVSGIEPR